MQASNYVEAEAGAVDAVGVRTASSRMKDGLKPTPVSLSTTPVGQNRRKTETSKKKTKRVNAVRANRSPRSASPKR